MMSAFDDLQGPDGAAVHIRRATPGDAAPLLGYLRLVGGESAFLSFGSEGPPLTEVEERSHLARMEMADNAFLLIAEWHDEIVGHISFAGGNRPRTRHVGEFGITVTGSCQRIGLGRRLLELLIDWATKGGVIRKINLLVRTDNHRAVRLYESLGFTVEGRKRRDVCIDGDFHDALLMGLLVDPHVEDGRGVRSAADVIMRLT